jgi:hypothetical protein
LQCACVSAFAESQDFPEDKILPKTSKRGLRRLTRRGSDFGQRLLPGFCQFGERCPAAPGTFDDVSGNAPAYGVFLAMRGLAADAVISPPMEGRC